MPQLPFQPQNAKKAADVAEAAAKCASPVLEPKYDGWRMIVIIDAEGEPRLFSRKGLSYTRQTPEPILTELRRFPPNTILDGEVVDSIDNKNCTAVTNVFGKSTTPALQLEKDRIHYIVFDCLEIDGHKVAAEGDSLLARRQIFETYSQGPLHPSILKRIALTAQAPAEQEYHNLFLELGFEGTMVKDLNTPYAFGKRGHGWFKIKATTEIDVVVMGMELDGKGQHEGKVGRFIVGQYQLGELCKRANVNPYDDAMREHMTAACLMGSENDFIGKVCTIKHYGVLKDGLRHPTFVKWREDKPAEECEYDNG